MTKTTVASVSSETKLALMRAMLRARRFGEKIIDVYGAQDMKTPVHLSIGQEAIAAGVCLNLKPEDYLFTTHRSHAHLLSKGASMTAMVAELYGLAAGCSGGKGGSMHMLDTAVSCMGSSAIVGGSIPLGAGAALASQFRRDGRVSVSFFGDGASEEGLFHETMNFASLKKLPVLFVCENNSYATNSHIRARQPHFDVARRAESYDIPSVIVDGNDVFAVHAAAAGAVADIRAGKGPFFLECKTYRWRGHVGPECDYLKGCRPKEELDQWMKLCPVQAFKDALLKDGALTMPAFDAMLKDIDAEIEGVWASARSGKMPEPEALYKDVYH
jgi:TPP-dependent pyruvate/acetoin dehydrogenase alpha subunit